ncbi:MAG TPA: biotin/lipoyl-containing protein, partial [Desulfobacterales bacterium]|nr:biotin/lipoyl-containing protein [Desulfobacterales bacterium]
MATIEIKVPSVGESVTEALLAQWFKQEADPVRKDEALFVLETDKVTLEVTAEAAGRLHIVVPAGTTVKVGAVVGAIDTISAAAAEIDTPAAESKKIHRAPEPKPPVVEKPPTAPAKTTPADPRSAVEGLPPSVRRLVAEYHLDASRIPGTGPDGRLTKGDVLLHIEQTKAAPAAAAGAPAAPAAEAVCLPCEGP